MVLQKFLGQIFQVNILSNVFVITQRQTQEQNSTLRRFWTYEKNLY